MHHFKKKNLNIFSPKRPRENVSPGFAVALDGPPFKSFFLVDSAIVKAVY